MAPDLGLGITGMSLADPGAQRVRSVEPSANGGIQIVLDETRQRTVSGGLDDQNIRVLLLSAAKDPSDPGLRYETVGILNDRAQTAEVRDTLIYALEHDENAGVRLKAMDGLKPFVQQPEVRKALTGVLLSDGNPGMRTQAIDLLTQGVGESTGNPTGNGSGSRYHRNAAGADESGEQRLRAAARGARAAAGERVAGNVLRRADEVANRQSGDGDGRGCGRARKRRWCAKARIGWGASAILSPIAPQCAPAGEYARQCGGAHGKPAIR